MIFLDKMCIRDSLRVQFASLWASLTRNTTGKKKKSAGKAVLVAILFVLSLIHI